MTFCNRYVILSDPILIGWPEPVCHSLSDRIGVRIVQAVLGLRSLTVVLIHSTVAWAHCINTSTALKLTLVHTMKSMRTVQIVTAELGSST